MSKVRYPAFALTLALVAAAAMPGAAAAMPAGPFAEACAPGSTDPAMLVRVTGFKTRTGIVRVQSYGGDPDHYFDKGSYLKRIELKVPPAGALEVCVPAPAPGRYAVAVYHLDDSGKKQGGGTSGNPRVSAFSLLMKRKPEPDKVAVTVGNGVSGVPIILNYMDGLSFGPISG